MLPGFCCKFFFDYDLDYCIGTNAIKNKLSLLTPLITDACENVAVLLKMLIGILKTHYLTKNMFLSKHIVSSPKKVGLHEL